MQEACQHGWYDQWDRHLHLFEEAVAAHAGTRFALATSSCTGALHILLAALGVGPGDEVVVPETTWVATVAPVCYLGATPIFVDVARDTWCLDPEALERAVTARTRVVIPVHMYGHPADMDAISRVASARGIAVIEDAAPGIGSRYKGRPVGGLGRAGVFSFQGAKPVVTGEGGMLVTSDADLFDRAYWYWDHCRTKEKVLCNDGIGYKYKMSNIQAALGLAQMERIDEIIEKRRQTFFWYRDRLSDIDGLALNAERPDCFNNYYVPTVVLNEKFNVDAEGLMAGLDAAGMGNRPFFRCLSKMPMFETVPAPVAEHLAANGVNLPSAATLTETDADRVARRVRALLVG